MPWWFTHCRRAIPGSVVGAWPNRFEMECSNCVETLIFLSLILELWFFYI